MIRDRLVCGINNVRIQRRLLQEPSLTYKSAFEKAQAMEFAAQDMAHMTESKPAPVYNMHNKSGTGKHSTNSSHPPTVECYRCGGHHYATKCRFMEATCRTCGKKSHLARVCRSSAKGSFQTSCKETSDGESQAPHSLRPTLIQTQSHSSLLTVYMKNHIHWHLLLLCQTTHCLHFLLMPSPLLLQYK